MGMTILNFKNIFESNGARIAIPKYEIIMSNMARGPTLYCLRSGRFSMYSRNLSNGNGVEVLGGTGIGGCQSDNFVTFSRGIDDFRIEITGK